MNNWSEITVDDACSAIIDYRGKTPVKSSSGIRLITAKVVKSGRINEEPAEFIAENYYNEWMRRGLPKLYDVVITTEAPLGEVGLIRDAGRVALGQRLILLRGKPQVVDQRFLHQVLQSSLVQSRIAARGTGTTVVGIKQSELRKVLLPLPPFEEQVRIGEILGAYDDLIEVNHRRVGLLEEMARGLFEEWFVRLRFPGHEDLAPVETDNGTFPAGWTLQAAGTLIDFDPRTRVSAEGEKPFLPMGCLSTSTSLIDDFQWRAGNSGAKFRNGDTLFARITPCLENGKTGLVRGLPDAGVGFGSTEFIVMRKAIAGPAFTYCLARLEEFRKHAERGMSGASGRQRAKTEVVAGFSIACPPPGSDMFDRYEVIAWPMLELAGTLGTAIKRLAASRDMLLPRLISGQLSVAEAERELARAA
jgi:type I restriction enzyme S subunit